MVVLRAFAPADLDDAFALDKVCFPPEIAYSKAELRYFLRKPSTFAIVAEKAGQMAGFLIAEGTSRANRKHIVTIDVVPAWRRSGVATRLMEAVEAHARASGCTALSLEVAVDNLVAQSFYARLGFMVTGRIVGYYNGLVDAFTMLKALGGDKPQAAQ